MKFTYNWLKDFINIKIAPEALAKKLTMAGLEVTSVEPLGGDFVFEAEVTSNRPDWLGIVGIAREIAAITGIKLKISTAKAKIKPQLKSSPLKIVIENKKDCPLYTAKIIKGVKVGPSPAWLKERLEAVGCRSINNIVDITNYLLFKYSQPLHAFDWDKLQSGGIVVRRAKNSERITTIDGDIKDLNPEILVIADDQRPVAIAGIMGSKESEVGEDTKNILLEAAVFHPVIVRRGGRLLGLTSESAYRFERGIDCGRTEEVSLEAVALIQELTGGSYYMAAAAGLKKPQEKKINLTPANISRILGLEIRQAKIRKILISLGLKVRTHGKGKFSVAIPSFRRDLNAEIDLAEEVARILGYENIPTVVPAFASRATLNNTVDLISLVKNILAGLGLSEVITYSLVDKKLLEDTDIALGRPLEIRNPLSREQEILRPTLFPSLMRCISYNLNQKQNAVSIFEIAKVFAAGDKAGPREELALGIALCGMRSWLLEQGLVKDKFGVLHLKGIAEALFQRLGIKDYRFVVNSNYRIDVFLGKEKIGVFLKFSREILERLDIKNKDVVAAELRLDEVFVHLNLERRFSPLPLYPGVARDISLVLEDDVLAEDLLATIKQKAGALLQEVDIVDCYQGEQIPQGLKGLTISCLYRSGERTLTEEEISPVHNLVCRTLEERFRARFR